jgi:hypothetical protein
MALLFFSSFALIEKTKIDINNTIDNIINNSGITKIRPGLSD